MYEAAGTVLLWLGVPLGLLIVSPAPPVLRRRWPGEQARRWLWILWLVIFVAGTLLRKDYAIAVLLAAAGLLLLIRWSIEWFPRRGTRPVAAVTSNVTDGPAAEAAAQRRRRRRGRHPAMRGVGESMTRHW